MSSSVNKVFLIGNMGKDPVIRATQDGKEIASLTIATSQSWKDKGTGERKENTQWHNVVVFNENLVRILRDYTRKGSKICVEGSLQTRKWTNKEGHDQYTTEVVVQGYGCSITLLDSAKQDDYEEQRAAHNEAKHDARAVAADLDDEIPF